MTQKFRRKKIFTALVLATGIMWSGVSSAALINGDFSDGFNGWQGQDDFLDFDPIPTNDNFNASTGQAVLTTDADNGGNAFLNIFQTFTLSIDALTLEFDYIWDHTSVDDVWLAQLVATSNAALLVDLTLDIDIAVLAGLEVELLFGLENNDFVNVTDDRLTIDNIVITERQATVPEPTTLLLISAGLLAMRRKFF